jgi:hypothetical protein
MFALLARVDHGGSSARYVCDLRDEWRFEKAGGSL